MTEPMANDKLERIEKALQAGMRFHARYPEEIGLKQFMETFSQELKGHAFEQVLDAADAVYASHPNGKLDYKVFHAALQSELAPEKIKLRDEMKLQNQGNEITTVTRDEWAVIEKEVRKTVADDKAIQEFVAAIGNDGPERGPELHRIDKAVAAASRFPVSHYSTDPEFQFALVGSFMNKFSQELKDHSIKQVLDAADAVYASHPNGKLDYKVFHAALQSELTPEKIKLREELSKLVPPQLFAVTGPSPSLSLQSLVAVELKPVEASHITPPPGTPKVGGVAGDRGKQ